MGWFGFDFNGDGDVSFAEHMFSMDMMGFFDDEKKHSSGFDLDDDFDDDFDEDTDFGDLGDDY